MKIVDEHMLQNIRQGNSDLVKQFMEAIYINTVYPLLYINIYVTYFSKVEPNFAVAFSKIWKIVDFIYSGLEGLNLLILTVLIKKKSFLIKAAGLRSDWVKNGLYILKIATLSNKKLKKSRKLNSAKQVPYKVVAKM